MEVIEIRNPFPGAKCYLVARAASTQDEAKRLAAGGLPHGSLVAAEVQTAGRGRFPERRWESEAGKNLLFTLFLEPPAAALPGLPLRIGSALCAAVSDYAEGQGASFPRPPRLKWPNDLMFGDRKAAGVLCEAGPLGVFAGIGLNCNQLAFPPALEAEASSLARELGREVGRWAILESFLRELRAELEGPDSVGEGGWRTKAEALLWKKGDDAVFLPGSEVSSAGSSPRRGALEGTIEGLDQAGALLFRVHGEGFARAFVSGELRAGKPHS